MEGGGDQFLWWQTEAKQSPLLSGFGLLIIANQTGVTDEALVKADLHIFHKDALDLKILYPKQARKCLP